MRGVQLLEKVTFTTDSAMTLPSAGDCAQARTLPVDPFAISRLTVAAHAPLAFAVVAVCTSTRLKASRTCTMTLFSKTLAAVPVTVSAPLVTSAVPPFGGLVMMIEVPGCGGCLKMQATHLAAYHRPVAFI